MSEIVVSILCMAYNHEKYIRDALNGFVMQKTNFLYEVLVNEDASTDHTAEIIREYEAKYPDLIKPIYQKENQYSKKDVSILKDILFPKAKGKYVAMYEGDDYWIDPLKLQKQVDAMEKHPEVDMCAHSAYEAFPESKLFFKKIAPSKEDRILTAEEVIKGGGSGYIATSSLLYRKKLDENMPLFRSKNMFDYALHLQGASRGGVLFIHDFMSVYRYLSANSWTRGIRKKTDRRTLVMEKMIWSLREFDEYTGHRYKEAVDDACLWREWQICKIKEDYEALKEDKFKIYNQNMSMKERMVLNLKENCPRFLELFQNIKILHMPKIDYFVFVKSLFQKVRFARKTQEEN